MAVPQLTDSWNNIAREIAAAASCLVPAAAVLASDDAGAWESNWLSCTCQHVMKEPSVPRVAVPLQVAFWSIQSGLVGWAGWLSVEPYWNIGVGSMVRVVPAPFPVPPDV